MTEAPFPDAVLAGSRRPRLFSPEAVPLAPALACDPRLLVQHPHPFLRVLPGLPKVPSSVHTSPASVCRGFCSSEPQLPASLCAGGVR